MGIFKFLKRSKKETSDEPAEVHVEEPQQTEETTVSPRPVRSNPSFRRRLSTESMKKLRRIGQCLRLIGDDLERRSQHGSSQDIANQDTDNTNQVVNENNGQSNVVYQNANIVNQESNPVNQESNPVNTEANEAEENIANRKFSTEI